MKINFVVCAKYVLPCARFASHVIEPNLVRTCTQLQIMAKDIKVDDRVVRASDAWPRGTWFGTGWEYTLFSL